MPFTFHALPIEGLVLIQPRAFDDERGCFLETYKASDFSGAGINGPFVQDNYSRSSRGTLRGLHFQREPHAQGKLVWVSAGRVWDVVVDLRAASTSFGRWHGLELSAATRRMLWIPAGFAHGFVALEDDSDLQYKCTAEYHGPSEGGLRWDDPELAIDWPLRDVLVSQRDANLPAFDTAADYYPRGERL